MISHLKKKGREGGWEAEDSCFKKPMNPCVGHLIVKSRCDPKLQLVTNLILSLLLCKRNFNSTFKKFEDIQLTKTRVPLIYGIFSTKPGNSENRALFLRLGPLSTLKQPD